MVFKFAVAQQFAVFTISLFATTSVSAASPQGQNPLQSVPAQFQGEWNSKPEDCGTGLNDSRLTIGAHVISFYESSGPILAVITKDKTGLALIARLKSGEDGTTVWDAPMKFELSENQAVLKDATQAGSTLVRYKCPAKIK